MIDQCIFLVKHTSDAEDVSTLEIPYYPVQIFVVDTPITPLITTVPTPFPYESIRVVPWNYNSTAYLYGKRLEERSYETQRPLIIHVPTEVCKHVETQKFVEIQKHVEVQKPAEVQEPAVNITGTGGMTQSGHVFAAPPPPEKENHGANANNKGNQPTDLE